MALPGSQLERTRRGLRASRPWLVAAWLGISGVLSAGCTREARAVRLPSDHPNTTIYSITCRAAIHTCREKAAEVCSGEYQVLQSSGAPVEPPRVSSAPGPRSTGSRYQRPDWVGELVVACGGELARPELAETVPAPAPVQPAPVLAPDQLCVPGITQLCLGPAACRGAQACLPDGRGYGPCDCGTARSADAGA
jgi:hypothetical protein